MQNEAKITIDVENINKVFDKYVSEFNLNDSQIKLKYYHIKQVAKISELLAKNLGLTEEQIKLAYTIGIFHDFGRFMQVTKYHTFSDRVSGVDHADYSLKILYEDNLIKDFNIDSKYDEIIKFAVFNHNKKEIAKTQNEAALLFAKIIRDADKLDIFRVLCEDEPKDFFWFKDFNCESIDERLMKSIETRSLLDYSFIKTNADQISSSFAYIFDIYFNLSLEIIKENKYLETYANRIFECFPSEMVHAQTKALLEIANNYINSKLNKA
jgi:HD superfamily phosphohydrolase YqeK